MKIPPLSAAAAAAAEAEAEARRIWIDVSI